jgi:hypothetical protein
MNKIKLVAGDWSSDGHGMTEVIWIESNLDLKSLEQAFKKGCKITKVKFENVAARHQDSTISIEDVAKLEKFGFDISKYSWYEEPDDDAWTLQDVDAFCDIWLWIAKIGNPDLQYNMVHVNEPAINIGGYGFFD